MKGLAKTRGPYWREQAKLYVRIYSELTTLKAQGGIGLHYPDRDGSTLYRLNYNITTT